MGGRNNAKLSDQGVENKWYFRDRVVRDGQYKLYVSTGREPEKLFDMQNDPWEQNNLLQNPETALRVKTLFSYIVDQPVQDNDPNYEPLAKQPWVVQVSAKSLVWKAGRPGVDPSVRPGKKGDRK